MTAWLKAALVRAARTAAQSALAVLGTTSVLTEVDWAVVGGSALLGAVFSLLTSVATDLPEVD